MVQKNAPAEGCGVLHQKVGFIKILSPLKDVTWSTFYHISSRIHHVTQGYMWPWTASDVVLKECKLYHYYGIFNDNFHDLIGLCSNADCGGDKEILGWGRHSVVLTSSPVPTTHTWWDPNL